MCGAHKLHPNSIGHIPISKWIKHIPCDHCGSSDANSVYSDGHQYCSVCNHYNPPTEVEIKTTNPFLKIIPIPEKFDGLPDRGISAETAKRYGVSYYPDGDFVHTYPYFDADGNHIANKSRLRTKDFRWQGDAKRATLFGQQLFPKGSARAITLVEGECDALAAYEMQGSRYPVVSVHSAGQAPRNCADNFEYLNSFESIVVCFDRDEAKVNPVSGEVHYPGQEAALAGGDTETVHRQGPEVYTAGTDVFSERHPLCQPGN